MSVVVVPAATALSGEWQWLPKPSGKFMYNSGSGTGLSFDTPADAAALEDAIRDLRTAWEAEIADQPEVA